MTFTFAPLPEPNEVTWAAGRLPTRTYASRTFVLALGQDAGHRGRYVHKVFDEVVEQDDVAWEWERHVVARSPGGRKQVEINIARHAGAVRKIRIQKVPTSGDMSKLEHVLELNREQSTRLIDVVKALDSIPVEGDSTVFVDDQLLRELFTDPDALGRAYAKDPERFKALIRSDASARDVLALQRRREFVQTMRTWLEDDATFNGESVAAGGPERAWQRLFEANPWVLGIGLGGQLLTSWDREKLEQATSGSSIVSKGKRTDALMRTNGIVRSMVFAEIKHHRTDLLASTHYRSACWGPSTELAGAIVQVQQTVRMAVRDLGEYVEDRAGDGARTGTGTFVTQPRAFLIAGSMEQLSGSGGAVIDDKVHSFELFRRNVTHPEILTFDEVLARAEWHVKLAEEQMESDES